MTKLVALVLLAFNTVIFAIVSLITMAVTLTIAALVFIPALIISVFTKKDRKE